MKNNLISIFTIVLLVLSSSIAIATGENTNLSIASSNILYVGGTGIGNYSKIKDAMDNASEGDTIFVFNGTYYEKLVINKSVSLVGEDKYSTIIDGLRLGETVRIENDHVNISGFTIRNSSKYGNALIFVSENNNVSNNLFSDNNKGGIQCHYDNNTLTNNQFYFHVSFGSNNNKIANNTFTNCGLFIEDGSASNTVVNNTVNNKPLAYLEDKSDLKINFAEEVILVNCENITIENLDIFNTSVAIEILNSNNCKIYNVSIKNIVLGIYLGYDSNNNSLHKNEINECMHPMVLRKSDGNIIYNNKFNKNGWDDEISGYAQAIDFGSSNNNTVYGNDFVRTSGWDVYLSNSNNNMFYHNNFTESVNFPHEYQHVYDSGNNYWNSTYGEGNYWDDYTGMDENLDGIGDAPYDIPGGDNQDLYPIVELEEDLNPPTIEITQPKKAFYLFNFKKMNLLLDNPLIFGRIEIQVNAMDYESGLKHVEFYIDDELKFTDGVEPFTYMWKEHSLFSSTHKHTIKIVAYDYTGNSNYKEITVRKYL